MKIIKTLIISIFTISLFAIPVFGKTTYYLPSKIECTIDGYKYYIAWYTYNKYGHLTKRSERNYEYDDLEEDETYISTFSYVYSKNGNRKKAKRSMKHNFDGIIYDSVNDATFDDNGYVKKYGINKYTWNSDGYLKNIKCNVSGSNYYGTYTYKYTFYKNGFPKIIELKKPDNTITTYKFNKKYLLSKIIESASKSSEGKTKTYKYLFDKNGLVSEVSYNEPNDGLYVYKISYSNKSISKKRYVSILSSITGVNSGNVSYYKSLLIK